MEEKFNKLSEDIWVTRKCRIIASERLNENENFCRFISIYYSILTTVLTIINMISIESKNIDVVTLVVSIAVTNFLLYLDTQNYKDRYLALKKNYLDLDKLQIKIKSLESKDDSKIYIELALEYNNLLREVENHKEYDYIKLALETPEYIERISNKKRINYYCRCGFRCLLKITVVVVPIIYVISQSLILFKR